MKYVLRIGVLFIYLQFDIGIQQALNDAWFSKSSKFHYLACFIRTKLSEIEAILQDFNCCLPDQVSYDVANLEKSSNWKAMTRHYWMYLFGPGTVLDSRDLFS